MFQSRQFIPVIYMRLSAYISVRYFQIGPEFTMCTKHETELNRITLSNSTAQPKGALSETLYIFLEMLIIFTGSYSLRLRLHPSECYTLSLHSCLQTFNSFVYKTVKIMIKDTFECLSCRFVSNHVIPDSSLMNVEVIHITFTHSRGTDKSDLRYSKCCIQRKLESAIRKEIVSQVPSHYVFRIRHHQHMQYGQKQCGKHVGISQKTKGTHGSYLFQVHD